MARFVEDSFTGDVGTDLLAHTGERGATWTRHPAQALALGHWILSAGGRAYGTPGGAYSQSSATHYLASGVPAATDHDIACVWHFKSHPGDPYHGITFGYHALSDTGYRLVYRGYTTFRQWALEKIALSAVTQLGEPWAQSPAANGDTIILIQCRTTGITVLFDGVPRLTTTDTSYTGASFRRVGLWAQGDSSSESTGYHPAHFCVADPGDAEGAPPGEPGTRLLIRRNDTPGTVPAADDLLLGELALCTGDGILYTKLVNESVVALGSAGPQGEPGPMGPEGPMGPAGPPGADGLDDVTGIITTRGDLITRTGPGTPYNDVALTIVPTSSHAVAIGSFANVTDGNDATSAAMSSAIGVWFKIDFGSPKQIVAWRTLSSSNSTTRPSTITLQSSVDNLNWSNQDVYSTTSAWDSTRRPCTVATARYWRILGSGTGSAWTLFTWELWDGTTAPLARFGVGPDGQVLTSMPAEPLGLGWTSSVTLDTAQTITGAKTFTANLAVAGVGSFGTGTGVLSIKDATVAPTTTPTGGGILYSQGAALKWAAPAWKQSLAGITYTQIGGVTVANTVVESNLHNAASQGTRTLAPNFWTVGKTLRLHARGYFSTAAIAPTGMFRAWLAGVNLGSTVAVPYGASLAYAPWVVDIEILCHAVGSSGGGAFVGTLSIGTSNATLQMTQYGFTSSYFTMNTTVALGLSLNFTWGTAAVENTLTATQLQHEILPSPTDP